MLHAMRLRAPTHSQTLGFLCRERHGTNILAPIESRRLCQRQRRWETQHGTRRPGGNDGHRPGWADAVSAADAAPEAHRDVERTIFLDRNKFRDVGGVDLGLVGSATLWGRAVTVTPATAITAVILPKEET
jgi:hypothetical protein